MGGYKVTNGIGIWSVFVHKEHWHRRMECRSLFICLIAVCCSVSEMAVAVEIENDKLAFVIAENERARSAVSTASYKLEFTHRFQQDGRWKVVVGEQEIVHGKDLNSWSASDWKRTDEAAGTEEFHDVVSVVHNDKYVGLKDNNLPVYAYLHDDPRLPNPEGLDRPETLNQRDILEYAYGSGAGGELRNYVTRKGMRTMVETVTSPDGSTEYAIRNYCAAFSIDPKNPESVFVVDPNRGFLITSETYYNKGGFPWLERTLEVKAFADSGTTSVWFPVGMNERRYGRSTDSERKANPDATIAVVLEDVAINPTVDPKQFNLDSLRGADLNQPIIVWNMDGTRWNAGFVGGLLMPFQEANNLKRSIEMPTAIDDLVTKPTEHNGNASPAADRMPNESQSVPPIPKPTPARRSRGVGSVLAVSGAIAALVCIFCIVKNLRRRERYE